MAQSLNVIALVSGGKDSLFSILHCQTNGHAIVALGNLHPAHSTNSNGEDIDSYMYQTVGHTVIPLYEQALGVPLYRQEILGNTVNSNRDYEKLEDQEHDETEDLVPLLGKIMKAHPEANAVSTGAILSTYQRTRVESVAWRMGLTPLSYLWQYPLLPPYTQSSLLSDMAMVGQKAVIVKTASGGLDESFLDLDVASQKTISKLRNAMARFGETSNGALVGEGGEFETLALDGPRPLWKRRIRLQDAVPKVLQGGQTILAIRASNLEEKMKDGETEHSAPRIPELFDEEFEKILRATENGKTDKSLLNRSVKDSTTSSNAPQLSHDILALELLPRNTYNDTPTVFTLSNLSSNNPPSSNTSPLRQLSEILLRLDHVLKQWQLVKSNINHCTLLLRSMDDFTVLNLVYGQYFSDANPPSRVTIAAGDSLPTGIDVTLSIILDKNGKDHQGEITRKTNRQGLHVQSRSYWAPANIGPYSQAISIQLPHAQDNQTESSEIVYIAGQIPLVPASMEIYTEDGFHGQAALSLQHLWRVGRAKNVRWWTAGVALIPTSDDAESHVRIVQNLWSKLHTPTNQLNPEEHKVEDMDPWDRRNNISATFNNSTFRAHIPDLDAIHAKDTAIPPCFIAQVASLPRDAQVEWSATGLTASSIWFETNGDSTFSTPTGSRSRFVTREVREESEFGVQQWTSATLYTGPGMKWNEKWNLKGVQWIPCRRVWGSAGHEIKGVLVGRVDDELVNKG
ncbi:ATP binding L-PSP endoribonuclease family protein-like protein [Phaeosphaeriaceae sp. PMI808]|nr:ATP binding L-PSP endoribonuclease family protein-like protein [Phaeosphaeriaceae sp. PMI808]